MDEASSQKALGQVCAQVYIGATFLFAGLRARTIATEQGLPLQAG